MSLEHHLVAPENKKVLKKKKKKSQYTIGTQEPTERAPSSQSGAIRATKLSSNGL